MYWDQHVKRSRLAHAPAATLGFVPDWYESIVAECVARRSALVVVWGDPHRALLDDIPSERVASDQMPLTPSLLQAVSQAQISWTFIPGPCPGLARAMLGEPDLDRLWDVLTPMLRLDARTRWWRGTNISLVSRIEPRRWSGTTSPHSVSAGVRQTSRSASWSRRVG